MRHKDSPANSTADSTTPGRPSIASTRFTVALMAAITIVAGLVLYAALANPA